MYKRKRNRRLGPIKLTPKNRHALSDILNYGIHTQPEAVKQILIGIKYKMANVNYLIISHASILILTCITTDYLHHIDQHFLDAYMDENHNSERANPLSKNLHNHFQCRVIHDRLLCICDSNPKLRRELKRILGTRA